MNARNVIDQLLGMGQQALKQNGLNNSLRQGADKVGFGGGVLTGGALGLLLGNNRLRKMGGGLLSYGGVAALGALAYKVYNEYQQQQSGSASASPTSFDKLPAPAAEQHAQAMLKALIA